MDLKIENNIHKLFFQLIRVAIGNAVCLPHTPKAEEWQMLYEMAKKQSLVGICFAGVQRLVSQHQSPPEMLYLQWMGMAAMIQQRNEVVNRQCAELQARFSADGWRSCILKGQGVASYYKVKGVRLDDKDLSPLRQSGDIDVLLWKDSLSSFENRKALMEYARQIDPDVTGSAHHVAVHMWRDTTSTGSAQVEVELHYEASYMCNPLANKRLQEWMRENRVNLKRLMLKEGEFDVPSVEFNIVFLLAHIFRHYVSEGVGLRQLMDYYFLLQAAQVRGYNLEVKGDLFCLPDSFNMKKFSSAVMWVLGYVFGLERDYMICEPNERLGRKLLEHIMQGGNFGHHNAEKVVKSGAHWANFVNQLAHDLHLAFDYPAEALWSPISMIKEFLRIRI